MMIATTSSSDGRAPATGAVGTLFGFPPDYKGDGHGGSSDDDLYYWDDGVGKAEREEGDADGEEDDPAASFFDEYLILDDDDTTETTNTTATAASSTSSMDEDFLAQLMDVSSNSSCGGLSSGSIKPEPGRRQEQEPQRLVHRPSTAGMAPAAVAAGQRNLTVPCASSSHPSPSRPFLSSKSISDSELLRLDSLSMRSPGMVFPPPSSSSPPLPSSSLQPAATRQRRRQQQQTLPPAVPAPLQLRGNSSPRKPGRFEAIRSTIRKATSPIRKSRLAAPPPQPPPQIVMSPPPATRAPSQTVQNAVSRGDKGTSDGCHHHQPPHHHPYHHSSTSIGDGMEDGLPHDFHDYDLHHASSQDYLASFVTGLVDDPFVDPALLTTSVNAPGTRTASVPVQNGKQSAASSFSSDSSSSSASPAVTGEMGRMYADSAAAASASGLSTASWPLTTSTSTTGTAYGSSVGGRACSSASSSSPTAISPSVLWAHHVASYAPAMSRDIGNEDSHAFIKHEPAPVPAPPPPLPPNWWHPGVMGGDANATHLAVLHMLHMQQQHQQHHHQGDMTPYEYEYTTATAGSTANGMAHHPQPRHALPQEIGLAAGQAASMPLHPPTAAVMAMPLKERRRARPKAPSSGARHHQPGAPLLASPRKQRRRSVSSSGVVAVGGGMSATLAAGCSTPTTVAASAPTTPSSSFSSMSSTGSVQSRRHAQRRSTSLQSLRLASPSLSSAGGERSLGLLASPSIAAAVRKRRSWTGAASTCTSMAMASPSRRERQLPPRTPSASFSTLVFSPPPPSASIPTTPGTATTSGFTTATAASTPTLTAASATATTPMKTPAPSTTGAPQTPSKAPTGGRTEFVNLTPSDHSLLMSGVAPSGSSKTRARREREAAERARRVSEALAQAVRAAGGDVERLRAEGIVL